MVSPLLNPTACWEFEGEILVLHHPTTISTRYQAMGTSHHTILIQCTTYLTRWLLRVKKKNKSEKIKEYDPPVGRVAAVVLNLDIYEKCT
jgi:GTPase